jgi:hypothetical protein
LPFTMTQPSPYPVNVLRPCESSRSNFTLES